MTLTIFRVKFSDGISIVHLTSLLTIFRGDGSRRLRQKHVYVGAANYGALFW